MAPTTKQNGYITWANFLVVVGIIVAAMTTLHTFVWSQHAREMVQFEKRFDGQFLMLKEHLNKIEVKLERIKK
ncbi:MAG: hypothetical protein GY701_28795 [Sulfitobacter sp.]|nr:hypothetical protein [Sulfitobacter sp.]